MQYDTKGYSYRTDYQYLIFVIGEWVSFLTDDAKTFRVFRDYGLLPSTMKPPKNQINRKGFAHFLGEVLRITIARDKTNKVGIESTPVDVYPIFKMAIIKKNDEVFDMKHIGFHTEQLSYFSEKVKNYLLENDRYLSDENGSQIAFDMRAVKAFWKKYLEEHSEGKSALFKVFHDDLVMRPDEVLVKNLKD